MGTGQAEKARTRAIAADLQAQPGVATSNLLGGGQGGQREKREVDLQWSMKVPRQRGLLYHLGRGN